MHGSRKRRRNSGFGGDGGGGGGGDGGGGRGRGRGYNNPLVYQGPVGAISVINPAGNLVQNFDSRIRVAQHNFWHLQAAPVFGHFDQVNVAQVPAARVHDWGVPVFNPASILPPLPDGSNDHFSNPQPPIIPTTAYRALEIGELMVRGTQAALANPALLAAVHETAWMFGGMVNSFKYGVAWDCFYYPFSDLFINQPSISQIIGYIVNILTNVLVIGNGAIHIADRVMLHFEGGTDVTTAGPRQMMVSARVAHQIGNLIANPIPVFDDIMNAFQSEHMHDFLFYRVYIHVLRALAGGTLKGMPKKYHDIRNGIHYKGLKKGYKAIDDIKDNSCGLVALIWGIAGTMTRMRKKYLLKKRVLPEGSAAFGNYRKRPKSRAASKLTTELKLEFAAACGWEDGAEATYEQLFIAFRSFCEKRSLNIGLLIFDAIVPARRPQCSYPVDGEFIPEDFICLIHWIYPGVSNAGHYDVIDKSYVTRWILHDTTKSSFARYNFRDLKIKYDGLDENKRKCKYCGFLDDYVQETSWEKKHDGTQRVNKIRCDVCQVKFRSKRCRDEHYMIQHGNAKPMCTSNQYCGVCGGVHRIKFDCKIAYCRMCNTKYERKTAHVCYIKYLNENKYKMGGQIIYMDLESDVIPETKQQRAMLCIAMYKDPCEDHIDTRFPPKDCKLCRDVEKRFNGYDCLSEFLNWVTKYHLGSTLVAHNGGKYDYQLLCEQIAADDSNFHVAKCIPRGTNLLYIEIRDKRDSKKGEFIRCIDSLNFILFPLDGFGSAFGLDQNKGLFPYDLLNDSNWRDIKKIPDATKFCITTKELECLTQIKLNNPPRGKYIQSVLDHIKDYENKEWIAEDKVLEYCSNDVKVLMDGCNIFRENFFNLVGIDPFQWITLASAVAASFRQPRFMPENSLQIFPADTRAKQRSAVRGGKCEVYCLYVDCSDDPDIEIKWVDVRSEYPFAMTTMHFPVGAVTYDKDYGSFLSYDRVSSLFYDATGINLYRVLTTPDGSIGMGIIECNIESAYSRYPILPCRGCPPGKTESKLLFMIRTGRWIGYTTLLAMAIFHRQVIVTGIKWIQFWGNTSKTLFTKWMAKLYGAKSMAGGWDKVIGNVSSLTPEEIKEFKATVITANAEMGIEINPEKVIPNKGLENTAKIMANCGWGYMCQKPTATDDTFFDNYDDEEVGKMGDLLESIGTHNDSRRIVGQPTRVGKLTRIRTTVDELDIPNESLNKNVCYQTGGQVPAYGQQILSGGVLTLNDDQPVYCDTDSIFYIYNRKNIEHKVIKSGVLLGDWVDEVSKGRRITKFVCIGPKSYFYRIEGPKEGEVEYKGKFKGIPLYSRSFSMLDKDEKIARMGMDEMEAFLEDALFRERKEDDPYLTVPLHFTTPFKRSLDFTIKAAEQSKTVKLTFDKRRVVIPRGASLLAECTIIRTEPHDDGLSDLTKERVEEWHSQRRRGERKCT